MKTCKAACIGCGKCEKECKFDAIKIENNLSYIDPENAACAASVLKHVLHMPLLQ